MLGSTCFALFDLHQARLSLDAAHREFLRRAIPWTRIRQPHGKPRAKKEEDPPLQVNNVGELRLHLLCLAPSMRTAGLFPPLHLSLMKTISSDTAIHRTEAAVSVYRKPNGLFPFVRLSRVPGSEIVSSV